MRAQIKYIFYLFLPLILLACEKTEPLSAGDFVDEDIVNSNRSFRAYLNNDPFITNIVNAEIKANKISIEATEEGETLSILVNGTQIGQYYGDEDAQNIIYYKNEIGEEFFSQKQDQEDLSEIIISNRREVDETSAEITGSFSAVLYHNNSDKKVDLTLGQFKDLNLQLPFFGKMRATYDRGDFTSTNCFYTSSNNQGVVVETIVAVGSNDSSSFTIVVRKPLSIGQLDVSSNDVSVIYNSNTFSTDILETNYMDQFGTLEILAISKEDQIVKGRFNVSLQNFKGDTLIFQMGNFEAVFQ